VNRRLPLVRLVVIAAVSVLGSGVLASAESLANAAGTNTAFTRELFEGASLGSIDNEVLGLAPGERANFSTEVRPIPAGVARASVAFIASSR